MHFKENAEIVTSELENIGRLDRVVVDPQTEAVTHLVVKKGRLFPEDRVIPADEVEMTSQDRVVLKKEAPHPDTYPRFEETDYVPAGSFEDFRDQPSREAGKLLWYHTAAHLPVDPKMRPDPPDSGEPLFHEKKQYNIPEKSVVIEEGGAVLGRHGEKLGEIHDVFAEPETLKVTYILVDSGWIQKDLKLIPSEWINDMSKGAVRLYVGKETFDSLPHAGRVRET